MQSFLTPSQPCTAKEAQILRPRHLNLQKRQTFFFLPTSLPRDSSGFHTPSDFFFPALCDQCAHVMAMAVQKIYPQAKVTIGPWIHNGFYYDFDVEPITDQDLKKIKKEMERIIGRNLPLIRDEAERRIMAINEPYKMEILQSIKEEPITIYHIGEEWWDLCAGPHVESTGNIHKKAVQLESVAGAYWRGDTNKPMLQRIYRTAWENEEQLKAYLHFKEEAKRRDHRRIG